MGAEAYATGHHVAFAQAPSLHTAAHEAAHIVQQRAGVQLKGGVGEVGDPYEKHADAVADRVVAGQSSESLLDEMAGGGGGGGGGGAAVQRKVGFELEVNWSVKREAATPAEREKEQAESDAHAERKEQVLGAARAAAQVEKDTQYNGLLRAYQATDKYKKHGRGPEPAKGKISETELRAAFPEYAGAMQEHQASVTEAMPRYLSNMLPERPQKVGCLPFWPFTKQQTEPQFNAYRPDRAAYTVRPDEQLARNQNDNAALEDFIPGINIAKGKSIMLGPDQPAAPAVAPAEGALPAAPAVDAVAAPPDAALPADAAPPPAAAAAVARNQLWDLTADQNSGVSQLEWVTKPLSTRAQVETALTEITRMGDQLNTAAAANPGPIDGATLAQDGVAIAPEFAGSGLKIYPDAARSLRADPQVTGGFRLDQLLPLMETLAGQEVTTRENGTGAETPQSTSTYMNKQTNPERESLGLATGQARAAKTTETIGGHPVSDELVSLLALILNYLHVGNGAEKLANSKGIAAGFMARTDFAHNFHLLPMSEQIYFRTTPTKLSELVGRISALDMNARVFTQGFQTAASQADEAIQYPLTRKAWCDGIAAGTDLLRKSVDADVPEKGIRRDPVRKPFLDKDGAQQPDPVHFSLGRLGSVDDKVGPANATAAVVELRRMNGGLAVADWKPFALAAFDLVETANHGGLPKPAAAAPAPAVPGPDHT